MAGREKEEGKGDGLGGSFMRTPVAGWANLRVRIRPGVLISCCPAMIITLDQGAKAVTTAGGSLIYDR